VLPLPLLAVCKGVACEDASFTCQANGQCDSDTVDSKNLPAYVANQPVPATDAATLIPDAQMPVLPMDAAVDKSVDSAVDRARIWRRTWQATGMPSLRREAQTLPRTRAARWGRMRAR